MSESFEPQSDTNTELSHAERKLAPVLWGEIYGLYGATDNLTVCTVMMILTEAVLNPGPQFKEVVNQTAHLVTEDVYEKIPGAKSLGTAYVVSLLERVVTYYREHPSFLTD